MPSRVKLPLAVLGFTILLGGTGLLLAQDRMVEFLILLVVLCALFAAFLHVSVSRPMQQLATAARELAAGTLEPRIELPGTGEFGEIGAGLNTLAVRLSAELGARRTAEESARESQRALTTLVGNLPGMAFRCKNDHNWTAEFVSKGAKALTGYTAEDFLAGKPQLGDIHDPLDEGRIWGEVQLALAERRAYEVEYRIFHADGTPRYAFERGIGIYDVNGNLCALEGFVMDITSLKAAEESKTRLERQLQQAQKMEAIGQLTGGIAHDFNNMLVSILGYADLALERIKGDTELTEYMGEIQQAGKRAADLVSRMLTFSRGTRVEPKSLQLADIVRQAVTLFRPALPSTMEVAFDPGNIDCDVKADEGQIQQVLMNLFINARDAMAGQGPLEVELRLATNVQAECASCHGRIEGNLARLSVRDSGAGMDAQTMARIFEPFFTTKEVGSGTGMGLAMVHGLVHNNGGHILVASAPKIGTVFELLFPLADGTDMGSQTDPRLQISPAPRQAPSNTHVLLVDDELSVLRFVFRCLTQHGYRVTTSNNPESALEIFAGAPATFDLLFTDQTMPKMTGMDLALRCRKLRPDLPVLLCTGYSAGLDHSRAAEYGLRGILKKPVTTETLLSAVKTALEPASA